MGDLAREDAFSEPNVRELVMKYVIIVLVLLLIPAINMSGITQSQMRKRMAEIGVRKAFGATRSELLTQVLYENLLQTLLGGVLGLFSHTPPYCSCPIGCWIRARHRWVSVAPSSMRR